MPETDRQVCPVPRSKMDVSDALGAAWGRVRMKIGRGKFADGLGIDGKTLSRAVSGETVPELHNVLNSLTVDQTALDEVIALYGMELRPRALSTEDDMRMISALSHLVGQWVDVMTDGIRDHRETLGLADMIRPMLPALQAIVAEADRLRGVVALPVQVSAR